MKIRPAQYECEICNSLFSTPKAAKDCESRGLASLPPVGTIFGDHRDGAFYSHITFAVAKAQNLGHELDISAWACRDNGAGDSLGKETCGGGPINRIESFVDRNHPTCRRMVEWLVRQGINPSFT